MVVSACKITNDTGIGAKCLWAGFNKLSILTLDPNFKRVKDT